MKRHSMMMQKSDANRRLSLVKIVWFSGLFIVFVGVLFSIRQSQELRSKASGLSCPVVIAPAFTPSKVIPSYGLSYPAVVPPNASNGTWLFFAGGLDGQMDARLRTNLPPEFSLHKGSQEEIWRFTSESLDGGWGVPKYSFSITDSTPVSFKNSRPYAEVYTNGFRSGCSALFNGKCNVQINDPSIVRYNNALYMYFSLLENYRWYDGTLGKIDATGPSNPKAQNIHAIGVAVSGDEGAHWAFVDKVIPESGVQAEVNGSKEDVLGAWAPSAVIAQDGSGVDIFFHDALGTKQYIAHLKGGVSITSVVRLNSFDRSYRVNLDVIHNGTNIEILYNDKDFNIVRTIISDISQFGLCPSSVIVPVSRGVMWPTPNQIITNDGKHHVFFWEFGKPQYIHHWVSK